MLGMEPPKVNPAILTNIELVVPPPCLHLELPQHVDQDAAVEHGLTVDGRDEVGDLLEGQRLKLLHDLGGALRVEGSYSTG